MTPYEQFRRAVRDLALLAESDVRDLWRLVQDSGPEALYELLPDVVDTYGSAAASLAADHYDDVRDRAEARGRFAPIVEAPRSAGIGELIGWATAKATSPESFRTLILGGVQKRIVNQSRAVVVRSSIADPAADGWMRIGRGECDFCAVLVSRGAVYTEETIDFKSHDWCNCNAAPAFDRNQIREITTDFVPSARRRSDAVKDADRERVHDWIAANL